MLAMTNLFQQISPQAVREKLRDAEAVRLVDVREDWEFARRRLPESLLMPMGEFAARCRSELGLDEEIIVVCEHGVRSENAAQFLASLGYAHVATMVGGMAAYDGPVEVGGG